MKAGLPRRSGTVLPPQGVPDAHWPPPSVPGPLGCDAARGLGVPPLPDHRRRPPGQRLVPLNARLTPAVPSPIASFADQAWTPIHYPNAIWDYQEQRLVSDAEGVIAVVGLGGEHRLATVAEHRRSPGHRRACKQPNGPKPERAAPAAGDGVAPAPVGAENRVTASAQRVHGRPTSPSPSRGSPSMIARCGLRTPLSDARLCAELAGTARPLRHAKDVEIPTLRHEVAVLRRPTPGRD